MNCFVPERGRQSRRASKANRQAKLSAHRNCHTLTTPARGRENARVEKLKSEQLERDWRNLLTHATIVKDPENILWLTAKLDQQRKRESARIPHRD